MGLADTPAEPTVAVSWQQDLAGVVVVVEHVGVAGTGDREVIVADDAALIATRETGEDRPMRIERTHHVARVVEESAQHLRRVGWAGALSQRAFPGEASHRFGFADEFPAGDRGLAPPPRHRRGDPLLEAHAVDLPRAPIVGVPRAVLEGVVLAGALTAGEDRQDQLVVASGGVEDRVHPGEVQQPGGALGGDGLEEVEPRQRTGRQCGEVGVEVHLRAAAIADRVVGADLVGVESGWPPGMSVEPEAGVRSGHPGRCGRRRTRARCCRGRGLRRDIGGASDSQQGERGDHDHDDRIGDPSGRRPPSAGWSGHTAERYPDAKVQW